MSHISLLWTLPSEVPPFEKGGRGGIFSRMLKYDARLKGTARSLRSNPTDSEQRLWSRLRRKQILGVQFYRQRPIGRYVVDFYAPAVRVVVEVDGGQHFEPEHAERDRQRSGYLQTQGLEVLRFTDHEVLLELDAVVEAIFAAVETRRNPPQSPFFKGGSSPPDGQCPEG
jgi:very-short-patch-repair endonuclease